jgi:hypothetical protein
LELLDWYPIAVGQPNCPPKCLASQQFEGTDSINIFLAGDSLKTLLSSLGI